MQPLQQKDPCILQTWLSHEQLSFKHADAVQHFEEAGNYMENALFGTRPLELLLHSSTIVQGLKALTHDDRMADTIADCV